MKIRNFLALDVGDVVESAEMGTLYFIIEKDEGEERFMGLHVYPGGFGLNELSWGSYRNYIAPKKQREVTQFKSIVIRYGNSLSWALKKSDEKELEK